MKTYKVMKKVEELINNQEDSKVLLQVVSLIESSYNHNTLWIELEDGSKFSIQICKLSKRTKI